MNVTELKRFIYFFRYLVDKGRRLGTTHWTRGCVDCYTLTNVYSAMITNVILSQANVAFFH